MLQEGRLSVYQETSALTALRNCAGALSDLVEVTTAGPFGWKTGDGAGDSKEEIGTTPLEEEPGTKSKGKKKEEEKPDTTGKATVAKKEKKKSKRKDKSTKKKSPSRSVEKRSPEIGDAKKEKEGRRLEATSSKKPHTDEEERRSPPKRRPRDREEESRREEKRETKRREEPSAHEVERDPARYGLEHIPIRGSAGRRRPDEVIPAGNRRPAEPVGPPPRREERSHYDDRGTRDSGTRNPAGGAKRWKGYSHYTRGVDYWKRRKSQR